MGELAKREDITCKMEKKRILLIGTGGTIASEMGENGLEPELTSRQLLRYIPDISEIGRASCRERVSSPV